jgi:asparagine synthase (glutamine-hydrolysing)
MELRRTLEEKGESFHSTSDTEVLLKLLIREGKDCLSKLNGFFAFAFYDIQEGSILLARDRFGIKPLYYSIDQDRLLFASEMKSLMHYGLEKELDTEAMLTYFQLNYIPAPLTIFRSVKKLKPGEYLKMNAQTYDIQPWYQLPRASPLTSSYEDQQKALFTLMEDSVKARLVSDVPLGSFLSGGTDSSIIAALAARHNPGIHTFSIGYRDEKFFDETAYAREVSEKIGTQHHVFSLSNRDLFDHLYQVLDYTDEPFADSSALAVYILSKETKKHATVALSGDGADELFGGYNKHMAFQQIIDGGPRASVVKALGPLWKILPKSRHSTLTNKFRQLDRFSRGMRLSSSERYWAWAGYAGEHEVRRLLNEEYREKLRMTEYFKLKDSWLGNIPMKEALNDLLRTDVGLVLPDDMLTKVDRMSMAHGLEVRVPFLDHRVVEFAFQLGTEAKINRGIRKRILQDTFRELLPASLYNRPKKGFEVPLLPWLRQDLKGLIEDDLLSDRFIKEQGIFNPSEIARLRKKLFSSDPGDIHARIWALVVFQWWYKKNFVL